MEPFSITCTTCKSRLKVRSAAAIGQVVSCPKCGGMVLVKAPEEVPPEVASAATKPVEQQGEKANPHNTKDFDDIESILSGAASVPAAAVSRGEQPRGADKVTTPPPAQPATAAKAAAQPPSPPPPTDVASPAGTAAHVPQARRYGLWLALSILIGIGLATAVVIAGSILGIGRVNIARSPGPEIAAAKAAESPAAEAPAGKTASATKRESKLPAEDQAKPFTELAVNPAEPPSTPQTKVAEKQDDPLGLVEPAKTTDKSAGPPLSIGSDPLGKFGRVLEGASDDPTPVPESTTVPEKSTEESAPDVAAPAAPRPAPRTVDVAARLADPLSGIDVPGVPLADFLADLSSLSTIPITLDPEGLPLVGLSAGSPVSLKAENTTVGKALSAALQALNLEYEVADDQLFVSLSGKLADRAFPVDDLTGKNEERAQQLAEWATALVEPAIWKEGDEEGPSLTPGIDQFAVRASDRTYAGLLLLMEKVRVARGLAPRAKQPAEVFRLESRSSKGAAKLATPISLNYGQPTLLVIILRRLEKEGQIRILIDWRALAAEGWNADGEGVLSAENQPLGESLAQLLGPLDLAWRAIDEHSVQVTTAAALNQTLELELYPARSLAADAGAGEALLARLRDALSLAETDEAVGALRFDPISGCILASLPQPKQRQVEKLLGEWGK